MYIGEEYNEFMENPMSRAFEELAKFVYDKSKGLEDGLPPGTKVMLACNADLVTLTEGGSRDITVLDMWKAYFYDVTIEGE